MGEVSTSSGGGTMATESQSTLYSITESKANFDLMRPLVDMTSRGEKHVDGFIVKYQAVVRFAQKAIAKAQGLQTEQTEKSEANNKMLYKVNDLVLLSTTKSSRTCSVQLGKQEAFIKIY
ncbi:hypothetical protein Plhal304r1_c097g0174101 [Plasmopara halstedii]